MSFTRSVVEYFGFTKTETRVILFILALVVALAYQRFVMRRDIEGAVTIYGG